MSRLIGLILAGPLLGCIDGSVPGERASVIRLDSGAQLASASEDAGPAPQDAALELAFLEMSYQEEIAVGYGQAREVRLSIEAPRVALGRCADRGGVVLAFSGPSGGVAKTKAEEPQAELCLDGDAESELVTFWVRGGDLGGSARVTARAAREAATLMLTLVGAPQSLTLEADVREVPLGSGVNLTAEVKDNVGQPVADVALIFSLLRCASLDCSDASESVSPAHVRTDGSGQAVSGYLAGQTLGAAQILVELDAFPPLSTTLILRVR